ncbi:MAG: TatD family hydrolase [Sphaerochaetaceae bacterium]|nr:TatD family hydrolase [Sphaerochaetaceae bacterium]
MNDTMGYMVDTNFHLLEMAKRGVDCSSLLEQIEQLGFSGGMDIGSGCCDVQERLLLVQGHPSIKIAAGIGPWGAQGDNDIISLVRTSAATWEHVPIDCIGEIGLDNYWKYGTVERQMQLFLYQLDIANELHLPVSIHMRDADEQLKAVLDSREFPFGGILHCFSSHLKIARKACDKGLYVSFAGNITYRNNGPLRDVFCSIPLSSILLETDSPYLSPEPLRGKTNTCEHIVHTYHYCANLLGIETELLAKTVKANFERLTGCYGKHAVTGVR